MEGLLDSWATGILMGSLVKIVGQGGSLIEDVNFDDDAEGNHGPRGRFKIDGHWYRLTVSEIEDPDEPFNVGPSVEGELVQR